MVRSFRDWLKIIVGGMCMGMANIVPGVSGGTMAFILGIYGRLLDSINSINSRTLGLFFRGRWRLAFQEISWRFLLAIGVGVGISLVSLAKGISVLLQHPIYRSYLFAFFFGLILASVGFCIRQVNQWRLQHFAVLGVGVVVAFTLTMVHFDSESGDSHFDVHIPKERIVVLAEGMDIQNYSTESSSLMGVSHATLSAMIAKDVIGRQTMVYSYQQHKMGTAEEFVQAGSASFIDWWLILCGMVTVSAMLLPGVSGSYILVIFGAYAPVVGAVADFSTGITALSVSTGTLVILLNFFCGMVLGALGFSRVVSWLLRHHRGLTIATLTGFVLGAIGAVWPFWSYEYRLVPLMLDKGPQLVSMYPRLPEFGSPDLLVTGGLALLGFASVVALEAVAGKKKIGVND